MTKALDPWKNPTGLKVFAVTWWPEDTPAEQLAHVVAPDMASAALRLSANPNDIKSIDNLGGVLFAKDAPPAGGRALTEAEIKATITEDGQFLVSLENGKKYRSLKKHLTGAGLTPDQYRAKWGLPAVYPMVSVGYSIMRRDMALAAGLGRGKKGKGAK
jgi:predicted transcriptional regulator